MWGEGAEKLPKRSSQTEAITYLSMIFKPTCSLWAVWPMSTVVLMMTQTVIEIYKLRIVTKTNTKLTTNDNFSNTYCLSVFIMSGLTVFLEIILHFSMFLMLIRPSGWLSYTAMISTSGPSTFSRYNQRHLDSSASAL